MAEERKGQQSDLGGAADRESLPEGAFQLLLHVLAKLGKWKLPASIVVLLIVGAFAVFATLPDEMKMRCIVPFLQDETKYVGGTAYVGLAVDSNTQVVDLREWTPSRAPDDKQCCKVTWDYRATARRLREDTTLFSHRVATTGIEPRFTSSTHNVSFREDDRPRVSGPTMTRYDAHLDISQQALDDPFELHLRTVRFGAFKDQQTEWAATAIVNATKRIEITILFPAEKPASNLRFSYSTRLNNRNYASLKVLESDCVFTGDKLVWTIEAPEIGYAYRVDWDW